ncbi:SpoIIE family protein phosphatase [Phycisphaeraceae bacterium D3-23]
MPRRTHPPALIPRIRSRRGLIVAAVLLQVVVLAFAWVVAFRHVRGKITLAVQDYIVEENAEFAEILQDRLLMESSHPGEFESDNWELWQGVIEQAGADLPGGGFACLLDAEGNILCHPDIRTDQGLRNVNLHGKIVEAVNNEGKNTRIDTVADGETYSGRVEFAAEGTHYVATQKIAGTDYRLLVHQPEAELFGASSDITGPIVYSGIAAVGVVVLIGGFGLFFIVRSYDSTYAELNERLVGNLQVARELQQATLPKAMPMLRGFDLAAWNQPADETGGDTYDAVALMRDGHRYKLADTDAPDAVLLSLADATGHGIGAALAAHGFHTATRMAAAHADSLGQLASSVNARLHEDLPDGRFATGWFGLIEAGRATIASYSAGQGPILLVRAADQSVQQLDTDSWPLGIQPDVASADAAKITLEPGDVLLVSTDGLFEAMSPAGEQYGIDRLTRTLVSAIDQPAADILKTLRHELDRFTQAAPADDDRTAVVVKFVG